MMADPKGINKLEAKEAADFLKKSGLPKEMLRKIWLIAARTDTSFLLKEELYLAFRLVALAQNNMEVSEECIKLNHPLPPPPKFDFKVVTQNEPESNINNF